MTGGRAHKTIEREKERERERERGGVRVRGEGVLGEANVCAHEYENYN